MQKIAYLFGAGASYNALPIVKEIRERLLKVIGILKQAQFILPHEKFASLAVKNAKTQREYQIEMIEALHWLYTESENSASIDTYAKKLLIRKRFNELRKLKIALSIFFTIEQMLNKPDNRYDYFYAALINDVFDLPENLRILSWNYDFQFEIAFSEYSNEELLPSNQRKLNVKSKSFRNRESEGFSINKLNGTASLLKDSGFEESSFYHNFNVPLDKPVISQIVYKYAQAYYDNKYMISLSFAWEPEKGDRKALDMALKDTIDTEILIVVGYSFPFFNREIDRRIINNMGNLRKVYFQAPDADNLVQRFEAIRDDIDKKYLVPIKDVEQFLIPNEL